MNNDDDIEKFESQLIDFIGKQKRTLSPGVVGYSTMRVISHMMLFCKSPSISNETVKEVFLEAFSDAEEMFKPKKEGVDSP